MLCEDAYSQIDEDAEDVFGPFISQTEKIISNLREDGYDPCNYVDPRTRERFDYCSILESYKSAMETVKDEAKDQVKCFENNTELTAQKILVGVNEIAVAVVSLLLGVSLPEKAFYIDVLDLKENPLGGENSLVRKFGSQAARVIDDITPDVTVGKVESPVSVTVKPGTNKHGLPNIKIRSKCFLTTACVSSRGLPDDCVQLETLRQFRDTYMFGLPNGRELIAEYYRDAPLVVDAIDVSGNSAEYDRIYDELVAPAVELIGSGENRKAFELYADTFRQLRASYL